MLLTLIVSFWYMKAIGTSDGALIATLVEDMEPICKYDQNSINAMCGSIVFCKMHQNQKSLYCKCEKLITPNQFSGLYNMPLSTYECSPLRTSFCLPPSIEEGVSSDEGCFLINLTQVKIENQTKILQTSQFRAMSVKNPKIVIIEFVFQSSVSQVLNKPIENIQIKVGTRHTQTYEKVLRLTAMACLVVVAVFKILYNGLSE